MGRKPQNFLPTEPYIQLVPNLIINPQTLQNEEALKQIMTLLKDFKDPCSLAFDTSFRYTGFAIRKKERILSGILSPCGYTVNKRDKIVMDKESLIVNDSEIIIWYENVFDLILSIVQPRYVLSEAPILTQFTNINSLKMYFTHAILLRALRLKDVTFSYVPVGTLKKVATGNGKAKKESMRDAMCILYSKDPEEVTSEWVSWDDQVDAVLLSSVGAYWGEMNVIPTGQY